MAYNKESVVVSNLQICKTVSYGFEPVSDEPSITVRGERLDFRNLLARASAGILDLNMFSLPRTCDISGGSVTDEKINELMDCPRTVLDNAFGASVEEAEAEMLRHKSVLAEQMKKNQQQQEQKQVGSGAPVE